MSEASDHRMPSQPATPALDTMLRARESGWSSHVQQFIDWLTSNGYAIARVCPRHHDAEDRRCSVCSDTGLAGATHDYEELMRRCLGVDSRAVERERRALLTWVGNNQAKAARVEGQMTW